tara:strand:+ start:276 stop:1007 length:732 start_codon:yes stop_codon:yes gene_type:complete
MSNYIAMWSGPRNLSTALMRSFENRSDCFVSDEPLYPFFLHERKLEHPLKNKIIKSGEINYNKIIKYITGPIPYSKKIWYQKHMAHHISPDININWIKKMKNCLLIRHPNDVILSYLKKNELENTQQLGYLQQVYIYKMLSQKTESSPIVFDAQDLLKNPKKMLIEVCGNLKIKFDDRMLSWPSGARETDGVWGEYWYKKVKTSTSFKPYIETKKNIPSKYKNIYDESIEYYNFLYQKRIILT